MVTADAVVSKLSSRLCTTDAAIPHYPWDQIKFYLIRLKFYK